MPDVPAHASLDHWQIRDPRCVAWAAVICAQLPGARHPLTAQNQSFLAEPGVHSVKRRHQCWRSFWHIEEGPWPIFQWQQIVQHNPCLGKAVCLGTSLGPSRHGTPFSSRDQLEHVRGHGGQAS